MKLSISNIGWESGKDRQIYDWMKELGYTGLEIAPTRILPQGPYDRLPEAMAWRQELGRNYKFEVPSMQSIWFGRTESIFGSSEERDSLLCYTQKAMDFAVAIQCGNLVFGCPRNRAIPQGMSWEEAMEIAIPFFHAMGEYACEKGTTIGMEANPSIYHTNFINGTEEALALVEAVGSRGFLLNLDVGTMLQNEENVDVLRGKVSQINHVHISEPYLASIRQRELHKSLAELLKTEGYNRYVSIEMGKQEDVAVIHSTLSYVKEIFGDL